MYTPFISALQVEQIDGQRWRLISPFHYCSQNAVDVIVVPAGFVTDFASTPRIVWSLMPKSGAYDGAAALHDYIYQCGGMVRLPGISQCVYHRYTKLQADRLFRDAMELLGVSRVIRNLMYAAVRLAGRGAFAKPPAQDANGLPIGVKA